MTKGVIGKIVIFVSGLLFGLLTGVLMEHNGKTKVSVDSSSRAYEQTIVLSKEPINAKAGIWPDSLHDGRLLVLGKQEKFKDPVFGSFFPTHRVFCLEEQHHSFFEDARPGVPVRLRYEPFAIGEFYTDEKGQLHSSSAEGVALVRCLALVEESKLAPASK